MCLHFACGFCACCFVPLLVFAFTCLYFYSNFISVVHRMGYSDRNRMESASPYSVCILPFFLSFNFFFIFLCSLLVSLLRSFSCCLISCRFLSLSVSYPAFPSHLVSSLLALLTFCTFMSVLNSLLHLFFLLIFLLFPPPLVSFMLSFISSSCPFLSCFYLLSFLFFIFPSFVLISSHSFSLVSSCWIHFLNPLRSPPYFLFVFIFPSPASSDAVIIDVYSYLSSFSSDFLTQ